MASDPFGAECITHPGRWRKWQLRLAGVIKSRLPHADLLLVPAYSGMPETEPGTALLAGRLARAVGSGATVCVGCPLAGAPKPSPLLTLCVPPVQTLPLRIEQQLLVVYRLSVGADLAAAACAMANVPEVWLLQPADEWLERLTRPDEGRYRKRGMVLPRESMALAALPAVRLVPLEAG